MMEPFEPETAATSSPAPPKLPISHMLQRWIRDLFIALGIATFIIVFVYQPVKVEGVSMLPGLADQERIFVNKFVYHWTTIQRGDVIVFRYPGDRTTPYIKRVVAVGGDRIRIEDGQVFVNGQELRESYVPRAFFDPSGLPEMTVPQGSYFVLGDHRNRSKDSREFGPVDPDLIIGKAVFGYWPVERMGTVR